MVNPYNEFTRAYRARCASEGRKFDIRECAAAWKRQKGAEKPNFSHREHGAVHALPPPPAPKQEPSGTGSAEAFAFEPAEASAPMTVVVEPTKEGETGGEAPSQTPGPVAGPPPPDRYLVMARGIHRLERDLLKSFTNGRVHLDDELLRDLDQAGAELLRKYDPDGQVAEYGPEIGYLAAQASVVFQYIAYKREEKQAQPPVAVPVEKAIAPTRDDRDDNKAEKVPWSL